MFSCAERMTPLDDEEIGSFMIGKIDRIIEEHILGGNPVEEYLIPSQYWGEAVNLAK